MRRNESKVARDLENPDPHELHKPIPKVFLAPVTYGEPASGGNTGYRPSPRAPWQLAHEVA